MYRIISHKSGGKTHPIAVGNATFSGLDEAWKVCRRLVEYFIETNGLVGRHLGQKGYDYFFITYWDDYHQDFVVVKWFIQYFDDEYDEVWDEYK